MTVLQFLRDRYCGKQIKYFVRTIKYDSGKKKEVLYNTNKCFLPEWVERGSSDDPMVMKDVETIGKVVSVNPFRNKWKLELLNGTVIIMDQYQEYEFYLQPSNKQLKL